VLKTALINKNNNKRLKLLQIVFDFSPFQNDPFVSMCYAIHILVIVAILTLVKEQHLSFGTHGIYLFR